ncbi:MAG: formylglycine-generating enzyme family protein [Deltaproteobacteria bacterium]|nr:formylglycine-generating enzyme family protein [Deltaproteobacteria bacterium]
MLSLILCGTCVEGLEPPEPTALIDVKGGPFLFGSTEPCFNENQQVIDCGGNKYGMPKTYPTVVVDLGDFAIDEHEVTNIQYEYCVANGACPEPDFNNTIGIEHYFLESAYEDYPVVNVTPAMAKAYCAFVGRRLPTEAEWERAAAGGKATALGDEALKRKYPFMGGSDNIKDCVGRSIAHAYCTGLTRPARVMSSSDDWVDEPGGRIWDLTGNVAELVAGFYKEELTCKESLFDDGGACVDCFTCNSSCISTCYTTCAKCDNDPDCFKQCVIPPDTSTGDPGFPGIPRCISYGATVLSPDKLDVDSGNEWLARGGSFNDGQNLTCRALSTDRNSQHRRGPTGKSDPVVGFRCAVDR